MATVMGGDGWGRDNCNPRGSRINKRGIVLRDLGSTVRKWTAGVLHSTLYKARK